MKTIIAGALIASLAACAVDDVTTETDEQSLYGGVSWGNATDGASIPVCFMAAYIYTDFQARVKTYLKNSWSSYAKIGFTGFNQCPTTASYRKVRVYLVNEPNYRAHTDNDFNGDKQVFLSIYHAADDNYADFQAQVVHEFGHVLGYSHEMQRPDNWTTGVSKNCPAQPDDLLNYGSLPGGTYFTLTYDTNSIMNYCRPAFGPDLSLGDISGVRLGYGTRDVKGGIYVVDANNDLHWYRHDGRTTGIFSWAGTSGAVVGHGWAFRKIFSGGGSLGTLYGIDANNLLYWYRHDERTDGGPLWTFESGKLPIGSGWNYETIFGAGDGVIYGVTPPIPAHFEGGQFRPLNPGGNLIWYRHTGNTYGTFSWAPGSGTQVGSGWDAFQTAFSGGNGILYGITKVVPAHFDVVTNRFIPETGGDLLWYRHTGATTGQGTWGAGSGTVVKKGFGHYKRVFSGGDGVIYAIDQSDQLLWFRHDGQATGAATWATASGSPVGYGWAFAQIVGDD